MSNFGDMLREFRKLAGVSQASLAASAGYASHSIVKDLEAGRRKGTPLLVGKFAIALQLTTEETVELYKAAAIDQGYEIIGE